MASPPATQTALPPLPNTDSLVAHFNASNNDVAPEDVVVLDVPNTINGVRRNLNNTHMRWIKNNLFTTATKFARIEQTDERIFWVPNTTELLKKYQSETV